MERSYRTCGSVLIGALRVKLEVEVRQDKKKEAYGLRFPPLEPTIQHSRVLISPANHSSQGFVQTLLPNTVSLRTL